MKLLVYSPASITHTAAPAVWLIGPGILLFLLYAYLVFYSLFLVLFCLYFV
jgi:hypothetical protein